MAIDFLTITPTDTNIQIAKSIKSREQELNSYSFEQAGYVSSITALGDISWDDTTLKYKGLPRDAAIARALADGLDDTAIQGILNLLSLDAYSINLQAVTHEIAKATQQYNNLLTALPAGPDRDAAFATLAATAKS